MKRASLASGLKKLRENAYEPRELTAYLLPREIIAIADVYSGLEHLHGVVQARKNKAKGASTARWFYIPKQLAKRVGII